MKNWNTCNSCGCYWYITGFSRNVIDIKTKNSICNECVDAHFLSREYDVLDAAYQVNVNDDSQTYETALSKLLLATYNIRALPKIWGYDE